MYIYHKQSEPLEPFHEMWQGYDFAVFTDSDRDMLSYQKMLEQLHPHTDSVAIWSLYDLGQEKKDILEQVHWFRQNGICLYILQYPVLRENPGLQLNQVLLGLLEDVLRDELSREQHPMAYIANRRNEHSGRKKIVYPDNWEKLYQQWIDKSITAKQFMQQAGLKRGTFYHMVAEYRESIRTSNVQINRTNDR